MLQRIDIQHFRNLSHVSLECVPGFNLVCGQNGSGKTSLLEAIYFLSHSRSFRTTLLSRMISEGSSAFTLYAEIKTDQLLKVGLSRAKDGTAKMRMNGANLKSNAEIAKVLPSILFHPESFELLTAGSRGRRQLMDWGVFYVERSFFKAWQTAKKQLEQRNATLKIRHSTQLIESWNQGLVESAEQLDKLRHQYVAQLRLEFNRILSNFLPEYEISLSYYRGWPKDTPLMEVLNAQYQHDLKSGYTHYGPHRADLKIKVKHTPAEEVLSRGQQKLLICALKIAQGSVFMQHSGHSPLYLLDDLASELDAKNRQLLIQQLKNLNAQVFLSSIEKESLVQYLPESTQIFCINQGTVS